MYYIFNKEVDGCELHWELKFAWKYNKAWIVYDFMMLVINCRWNSKPNQSYGIP